MTDKIEELTLMFKTEKNRLSKRVLQMRMGDLRLLGVSTFDDLDKLNHEHGDGMSSMGSSQLSSHSFGAASRGEKKQSRADEGKKEDRVEIIIENCIFRLVIYTFLVIHAC